LRPSYEDEASQENLLSIVIPAFNEAQTVGTVVGEILARQMPFLHEVIVVDDGSTDGTAQAAKMAGARVIRHDSNLGYGASLKTAIKSVQAEYVLTMDADGQHPIDQIAALWQAAPEHDMVVGQRLGLVHSQLWRMPGKWLLWKFANYLTRREIPDLNSGLRLFRRSVVLRYLHLCPSGFSFSTTTTMIFLHRGYAVAYVPIRVEKRRSGRSRVSVSTGLDTIILILRLSVLFDPLRVFLPASAVVGLGGILWGLPYVLLHRGLSVAAMLAIVTAIVLFSLGLLSDQISQMRLERFE
jgi:glycosyltransferase involved in cell wall biosynthesis